MRALTNINLILVNYTYLFRKNLVYSTYSNKSCTKPSLHLILPIFS